MRSSMKGRGHLYIQGLPAVNAIPVKQCVGLLTVIKRERGVVWTRVHDNEVYVKIHSGEAEEPAIKRDQRLYIAFSPTDISRSITPLPTKSPCEKNNHHNHPE